MFSSQQLNQMGSLFPISFDVDPFRIKTTLCTASDQSKSFILAYHEPVRKFFVYVPRRVHLFEDYKGCDLRGVILSRTSSSCLKTAIISSFYSKAFSSKLHRIETVHIFRSINVFRACLKYLRSYLIKGKDWIILWIFQQYPTRIIFFQRIFLSSALHIHVHKL